MTTPTPSDRTRFHESEEYERAFRSWQRKYTTAAMVDLQPTALEPFPAAKPDYSHLPELPRLVNELHPFLTQLQRAGGGTVRRVHLGGLGDVLCFTDCALYPYLLYLEYRYELLLPAVVENCPDGSRRLVIVESLADAQARLPELAQAYQAAIQQPRKGAA